MLHIPACTPEGRTAHGQRVGQVRAEMKNKHVRTSRVAAPPAENGRAVATHATLNSYIRENFKSVFLLLNYGHRLTMIAVELRLNNLCKLIMFRWHTVVN